MVKSGMVKKNIKNRRGVARRVPTVSAPQIILMALQKLANAPFDVLFEYGKLKHQFSAPTARIAIHRLQKKRLIQCERRGNKLLFMLTKEGEQEVENIKSKLALSKPKKWDGRWRVIVFDVPEKLRGKRDVLRRALVSLGFIRLQRSVWVYPHALPQEFKDLLISANIYGHCMVFEADNLENEDEIKRLFRKEALMT